MPYSEAGNQDNNSHFEACDSPHLRLACSSGPDKYRRNITHTFAKMRGPITKFIIKTKEKDMF